VNRFRLVNVIGNSVHSDLRTAMYGVVSQKTLEVIDSAVDATEYSAESALTRTAIYFLMKREVAAIQSFDSQACDLVEALI